MSAKSLIGQALVSTPSWLAVTDIAAATDYGLEVVADTSENVYAIIGHQSQARLIKYNSTGVMQWFKNLGVAVAKGIAKDSSNNIYAVGQSESTKCFIQKFTSSGTLVWQKTIDSLSADSAVSVKVDTAGNVILAGNSGSIGLLVKLNSTGGLVWERYLDYCVVYTVALDTSNNIYVGGNYEAGLFKINSSGTLQWVKKFTSTSGQQVEIYSSLVDSSGNIYIGGRIVNTSGFIAKLNSNGAFLWKKNVSTLMNETLSIIHSMIFKPDGTIVAVITTYDKCCLVNIDTAGTLLWGSKITGMALNSIALYNTTSLCGTGGLLDFNNSSAVNSSTAKTFTITLPLDGTVPKTGFYPSGVYYATTSPAYSDNTTLTVAAGTTVLTDPLTALAYVAARVQTPRMDASGNLLLPGADNTTNTIASLIYFNSSRVKQWQTTFDTGGQTDKLLDAVFYNTDIFILGQTNALAQVFFAKVNSSGTVAFQLVTGMTAGKLLKMLVDSSGNVYIAYCQSNYLFIVKSNSSGTKLWARQIQWSSGNLEVDVVGLSFDYLGNLVVMTSTDYEYSILHQINSSGSRIASKRIPQYAKALTTDSVLANIYVTYPVSNAANLAKINSSFTMLWRISIRDIYASTPTQRPTLQHITDSSGNTYIAFRNYNTVTTYLIKINSAGTLVWQMSSVGSQGASAAVDGMSLTPSNDLLVAFRKGNDVESYIAKIPANGSAIPSFPTTSSGFTVYVSTTTNIAITTETVTTLPDIATVASYVDCTTSFTWSAGGKTVGSAIATDTVYTTVAEVSTSSYTIADGTVTNTPTIIG